MSKRPTRLSGTCARLVTDATDIGAATSAETPVLTCRLRELDQLGVTIVKNGLPGEHPRHYCVHFGERPDLERVELFMQVFKVSKEIA